MASREGSKIDYKEVMTKIDSLPYGLTTSMQRDIAKGQPSELDAIAGAIVRRGARHGLACPGITEMMNMILTQKETRGHA